MANAKTSKNEGKAATNNSSQCSTRKNAEIINVYKDKEASTENPSSSTHPVHVAPKVRLPMLILVVLSLVEPDKEEKAIESCTVSCKRTTRSQKSKTIKG